MKRSQNNWEESIGKRLRDAESTPESHVWELLEMELDTHGASTKRKTYIITAAALLLLLMAASFIALLPGNNAELARFYSFQIPTYSQDLIAEKPTTISIENKVIEPINIHTSKVKSSKQSSNKTVIEPSLAVLLSDDNSSETTYEATQQKKVRKTQKASLKSIQSDYFDFENMNFSTTVSNSVLFNSINEDRGNLLSLMDFSDVEQLQEDEIALNFEPSEAFEIYNQSRKNLSSNNVGLPTKKWVTNSNTNLIASQQVGILTNQKEFRLNQNVNSINKELSNSKSLALNVIDLNRVESTEIEEVIETSEVVDVQHWLASTEKELSDWENLVEASKIDDIPLYIDEEILEELIEEAELDKEDPLTILQEEAKDLYYAKSINKGFHFGLVTGFQNSWITKNSRNPEVEREVSKNLFSPGYQVGLNVGYDFAKHFGIMAEFKFSDEGVRFHNPIKDRIEHLDLKYIEVPVYLKAKHSMQTSKMKPLVFNYLLGVQYSDLRSVSSFADGIEKRFAQDYNTSEWGLSAGFDFDYYFNKNLFITVGTRGSVSGFSKNFPRLNDANGTGTMSYSVGVYTRINFRLPGR